MKLALRFLLIVFLLGLTHSSIAQTFKIETGYYNPGLRGADTSTTYLNAYRVGATVAFKVYKNFSLESGAMYNVFYSNKRQGYPRTQYVNFISYGQSLDIPLHVKYDFALTQDLKVFAFGGPNLRIGLSMAQGIVSTLDSINLKSTGLESATHNMYKDNILYRMNLQMGVGGGVQWRKFMLKSGYDYGLFNLNREATNRKLYESGWYVTFGHQF